MTSESDQHESANDSDMPHRDDERPNGQAESGQPSEGRLSGESERIGTGNLNEDVRSASIPVMFETGNGSASLLLTFLPQSNCGDLARERDDLWVDLRRIQSGEGRVAVNVPMLERVADLGGRQP